MLIKNEGNNAWILTGFESNLSEGANRKGYDKSIPTNTSPTLTRADIGASLVASGSGQFASSTDTNVREKGQSNNTSQLNDTHTHSRRGRGVVASADNSVTSKSLKNKQQVQKDQAFITKKLGDKLASKITVVDRNTEIPETGKDIKRLASDNVEGWFDRKTKQIFIISDSITGDSNLTREERLLWVAQHELGHAGFNTTFGKDYRTLLRNARTHPLIKKMANKIYQERNEGHDTKQITKIIATEEALVEVYSAVKNNKLDALEKKYDIKIPAKYRNENMLATGKLGILFKKLRKLISKVLNRPMTDNEVISLLKGIDHGVKNFANSSENQTASESDFSDTKYSLKTPQSEIDTVRSQYQGTDKWLKAPNGEETKLSEKQWLQVRTPSFKKWFGDWENDPANASKVIDENGEPLVVYHGTDKQFTEFDPQKQSASQYGAKGFFFTERKDIAQLFGDKLMSVFLNARNGIIEKRQARLAGENIELDHIYPNDDRKIWIIFNANQIKSATNNNGDFDPDKDDIRFSVKSKNLEKVNQNFNNELDQLINGNLDSTHTFKLGKPNELLRSIGVPDLPIELKAKRLIKKANQENHIFDLKDVTDLPKYINNPLAVFSYGDKDKALNIITNINKGDNQFLVGLSLNFNDGNIDVNSIRGLFPKNNARWLNWIGKTEKNGEEKTLCLDKEKVQTLINQQRTNLADVEYLNLDYVESVVEDFENVNIDDDNIRYSVKPKSYERRPWENPPKQKGVIKQVKSWWGEGGKEFVHDKMFDGMGELGRLAKVSKKGEEMNLAFREVLAKTEREKEKHIEPLQKEMINTIAKAFNDQFAEIYKKSGMEFKKPTQGVAQFMADLDTTVKFLLHGKERNITVMINTKGEQKNGSGKTNAEIDAMKAWFDQNVPGIEDFAKQIYKDYLKPMNDYRDQVLLDAGLLTQEMINGRYNWEYYVPYTGFAEEADGIMDKLVSDTHQNVKVTLSSVFGKGGKLKEGEYQMKGRDGSESASIFETVANSASIGIARANMQQAKKALYEFAKTEEGQEALGSTITEHDISAKKVLKTDKDGEPVWQGANLFDYKSKDSDKTVVYQKGNTAYVIKIDNKKALNAMMNVSDRTQNVWSRGFEIATKGMASTYTRFSLAFAPVNKLRDSQSQWVYILADAPVGKHDDTHSGSLIRGWGTATKNIYSRIGVARRAAGLNAKYTAFAWKDNESRKEFMKYLEEYKDLGGHTTYSELLSIDKLKKFSDEVEKATLELTGLSGKEYIKQTKRIAKKYFSGMDRINDYLELTTRVSAYQALIENGVDKREAAHYVKDIMNFETKGEWAKKLGVLFPFVTTTTYDIKRMGNLVWKTKEGKVLLALGTALHMTMLELIGQLTGEDDDGVAFIDKVDMGIASGYFVIPLNDRGEGIRIPIGFGLPQIMATIANATRRFFKGYMGTGEYIGTLLVNAGIKNLTPIRPADWHNDPLDWAVQTFMPLVFKPIIQHVRNKNIFGNPIYKDDKWISKGELKHSSGYPWTNQVYKSFAKGVYKVTGYDISPETVAHFVNSYTGGVGRLVVDVMSLGYDTFGDGQVSTTTPAKRFPVVSSFVQTAPRQDSRKFKDIGEDLKDQHNKFYYELQYGGNFKKYANGEGWYRRQQAYNKSIRQLHKQEKMARKTLKGERLRNQLITIEQSIKRLQQGFNTEYEQWH